MVGLMVDERVSYLACRLVEKLAQSLVVPSAAMSGSELVFRLDLWLVGDLVVVKAL